MKDGGSAYRMMFASLCEFKKIIFGVGFLIGVLIAVLLIETEHKLSNLGESCYLNNPQKTQRWKSPLLDQVHEKKKVHKFPGNVSVTCVIFLQKIKNSQAVKKTWAKYCNESVYFSTTDEAFPAVHIHPQSSWHYLCESIIYIWNTYHNQLQWVLFVSDDTFAILDNLRSYVVSLDYKKPHYLGHALTLWGQLYNVRSAGYVLSKGAIAALHSKFNSTLSCQHSGKYWKNEDFYLGKHLGSLGITPEDTRDSHGRGRFHGYSFDLLLFPGKVSSLGHYYKKSVYPVSEGPECCSSSSITFHGTEADKMYLYHYLLYQVRVAKGDELPPAEPDAISEEQVWRRFVEEEGLGKANVTAEQYFDLWQRKISSPDHFNEEVRRQILGDAATAPGTAFANMPEVLESILAAAQSNASDVTPLS